MKVENRELLNRAIGMIDGLYFLSSEETRAGLDAVSVILGEILNSEVKDDD